MKDVTDVPKLSKVLFDFHNKCLLLNGKEVSDWNLRLTEYFVDIYEQAVMDIFKKEKEEIIEEEEF